MNLTRLPRSPILSLACAIAACASDPDSTVERAAQVVEGPTSPKPSVDLGQGDGSDVVMIGDSWMSFIDTGIEQSITRISGQPYRLYGVPGTRLLDGAIPGQYARAKADNPNIATVIMTGGGNDVILAGLGEDCAAGGAECAAELEKIGAGLQELWTQISNEHQCRSRWCASLSPRGREGVGRRELRRR